MQTEKARPSETTIFDRTYAGTADQVGKVRADATQAAIGYARVDDLVLLLSELATNAVVHTRSGLPDHEFTARMYLYDGEYVWSEVVDEGGRWDSGRREEDGGRGLSLVAAIAGEGNWGIDGDDASRVVWFRLDWDHA